MFFFFQILGHKQIIMCHVSRKQALTTKTVANNNGIFKNSVQIIFETTESVPERGEERHEQH
jgi:hypothetical protein